MKHAVTSLFIVHCEVKSLFLTHYFLGAVKFLDSANICSPYLSSLSFISLNLG